MRDTRLAYRYIIQCKYALLLHAQKQPVSPTLSFFCGKNCGDHDAPLTQSMTAHATLHIQTDSVKNWHGLPRKTQGTVSKTLRVMNIVWANLTPAT